MKNLLILEALPAWASNRLSRIKTPKRYLVEPSIIASVLRLDQAALLRDGNLLGRMIDTFVAAQIRPELAVAQSRPRWYHLREKNGSHEIDVVIEYGGGQVAAIEIKSTAAPAVRAGYLARHHTGRRLDYFELDSVPLATTSKTIRSWSTPVSGR